MMTLLRRRSHQDTRAKERERETLMEGKKRQKEAKSGLPFPPFFSLSTHPPHQLIITSSSPLLLAFRSSHTHSPSPSLPFPYAVRLAPVLLALSIDFIS